MLTRVYRIRICEQDMINTWFVMRFVLWYSNRSSPSYHGLACTTPDFVLYYLENAVESPIMCPLRIITAANRISSKDDLIAATIYTYLQGSFVPCSSEPI